MQHYTGTLSLVNELISDVRGMHKTSTDTYGTSEELQTTHSAHVLNNVLYRIIVRKWCASLAVMRIGGNSHARPWQHSPDCTITFGRRIIPYGPGIRVHCPDTKPRLNAIIGNSRHITIKSPTQRVSSTLLRNLAASRAAYNPLSSTIPGNHR